MLNLFLYPSVVYFAGTILSVALGFFHKSFLVKHLEFSYLGVYSLGMSVISMVMIFTTLGFSDGLIFFIPKYLSEKKYHRLHMYLKTTFIFNILLITIFSLIVLSIPDFILNKFLSTQRLKPFSFYFILILIIKSFTLIFIKIINGFQKVHKSVLIEKFICNPLKVFLTMILINSGFNFYGVLTAEIFALALAFVLFAKIVKNQLKILNIPSLYENRINAVNSIEKSYSKSMLLKNIFNQLSIHLGTVLIVVYTDLKQLGIYTLIISITSFIPIILNSVNAVFKPIISDLYAQGKIKVIKKYFLIVTRYTFILSLPFIVCLYLSKGAILNYFQIKNDAAETVFILLILVGFINCSKGPVYISLQMMGYDREIRNISFLNLFIKTLFSFILIPKYGVIGIGIAELLSVTIFILISSVTLYKKSSMHILNMRYLGHIIVSILSLFIINISLANYINSYPFYKLVWINLMAIIFIILPNLILIEKKEIKEVKSLFF